MDREGFWTLIEKSRGQASEWWRHHEPLEELLVESSAEEIISFSGHFGELMVQAYRWDLWAVAYIIEGGCSDDGFLDFRYWLIAQGEDFFNACLKDPQRVADRTNDALSYESMGSVAYTAYERKTGEEMPYNGSNGPDEPVGRHWENEDELRAMYPDLWEQFQS